MSCATRNSIENKLEHMTVKPHCRLLQVCSLKFQHNRYFFFHRSAINKSQTLISVKCKTLLIKQSKGFLTHHFRTRKCNTAFGVSPASSNETFSSSKILLG